MTEPAPQSAPLPSGLVYGDVPNRIFAYIIDVIVLALINIVVGIVLGIIGLSVVTLDGLETSYNYLASIIVTAIGLAISAAYFIYSWTNMRATVGMKALSLQIGVAPGGTTITMDQGIRRWIALGAPFSVAQVLNPLPAVGMLIGLAALAWVIFLLYTTAQSPTKQGWHDVFANTMIVKSARTVG
ncbi:MAG: RDD family protein [Chloroflexota bacterium]